MTQPESTLATVKPVLAALLMLFLGACAARPPAPEAPTAPAPAPAAPVAPAEAPALGGRMIADAQEYPWSALGRVNFAGLGFCTGILIGPRQVLTQARCLYDGRDGRWFLPRELHFIAAYQKDDFAADSAVADIAVAPGFNPQGGTSLANLASNWAVITLSDPIGNVTGWLGLEWDSDALKAAAARGRAAYLRAGYRQDWPHAVSLHFGCDEPAESAVKLCAPTPSEMALPVFVMAGGELRVLANFYLRSPSQGAALAALAAAPIDDNRLGRSQPPLQDSLIGRRPTATAAQLLAALGYDISLGRTAEAATAFRRDAGLVPSGDLDLALVAALLSAVQHSWR